MRTIVMMLLVALAAPTVSAQVRPQRREEIKQRIRTLRAEKLTTALGLDDKSGAQVFTVLARWDDVTDKLLLARADITKRLRNAAGDPKAIDRMIDEAVVNQRAFWDVEEKRLAELRKILTPAQTARLVVLLPGFERRLERQLRRRVNIEALGARQRRVGISDGAALDDPDEDDVDDPPGPPPPPTPAPKGCDPFSSRQGCR